MKNKISIPTGKDYNEIWRDFKISFFSSFTNEKWIEELIDINSITYEFIKEDVENLFYSTGGYLQYLNFESIYRLSIEVTASQVLKNISKNKKCFFERDNLDNKHYLIVQRICNNARNVFDSKRKINVISLQSMIMDTIYENYEVDSFIDIEKLSKNEPAKLIFAINSLLNNYDLNYDEVLDISVKYNIDSSNFYILNFADQLKNLIKLPNKQIVIDFMEVA
jgi:hypothetical protein